MDIDDIWNEKVDNFFNIQIYEKTNNHNILIIISNTLCAKKALGLSFRIKLLIFFCKYFGGTCFYVTDLDCNPVSFVFIVFAFQYFVINYISTVPLNLLL